MLEKQSHHTLSQGSRECSKHKTESVNQLPSPKSEKLLVTVKIVLTLSSQQCEDQGSR